MWFNFARPRSGVGLLCASVVLALCSPAQALTHKPIAHVPEPVRGTGRLVKQVAHGEGARERGPERKQPVQGTRQARLGVGVPALLARSRSSWESQPSGPSIEMEHLTSRAVYHLRPDVKGGHFSPRQMGALATFLRCHHTGMRRPIDPRLISLLYETSRHYDNAKLYIIAGYRAPSVARQKGNPKSPHKRGVACDFRVDGVSIVQLRDYLLKTHHHVGVGYYPNAGFVHLDVGRQQDAYWIDASQPGERARYVASEDESQPAQPLPVLF